MKPLAAGAIVEARIASPEECLRYAMSLRTSVVVSGMDSLEVLEKNLAIARSFRPFSADERRALLARTAEAASAGAHERFKTSTDFDGTSQNPHWLESAKL